MTIAIHSYREGPEEVSLHLRYRRARLHDYVYLETRASSVLDCCLSILATLRGQLYANLSQFCLLRFHQVVTVWTTRNEEQQPSYFRTTSKTRRLSDGRCRPFRC